MKYDIEKRYTIEELQNLSSDELKELYINAKQVSQSVYSSKDKRKINSDIATIRQVVKGFNSTHNRNHK